MRSLLTACLAGLLIAGFSLSDAAAAAAGSGMRPGPAVWIEEYWEVKPGKLDEFVKTYRSEVYSLARKVPGYRGYTILTNIPDGSGFPPVPRMPDATLTPHYGIQLQGKMLTERSIDLGNLLRRTHNVIVIHTLQTWAESRSFRANMEAAYADAHHGAKLADHLAATLFPLANNYWETPFRLVETGLPVDAHSGRDADGLDLEPHASSPAEWYKEYFEVTAEDLPAFVEAYRNNTFATMSQIPGYKGVTILTTLAPNPTEAARTKYRGEMLGGPDAFYVAQPGVMMDGTIRTDTSINYSLLFKPTFTIITYYQFPPGVKMLEEMQRIFAREHPGEDRIKKVTREFFPHIQNHWDMHYRAIETSLVPLPPNRGN
ncbi:MAG TPA: hypothetical protein VFS52_16980 [Steroidobacteraceae bacterium]|jgi:hypothetical protein|nr:hypothetical protein [Steroidobacteraceae bacterium]